MVKKTLKVALIQPFVSVKNTENIQHVGSLIAKAAGDKPDIICLPERWWYVDPISLPINQWIQPERGEQYQQVQRWAREFHVSIISGAIWEQHQGQPQPFISSYYFNADGVEQFRQDKIQLYLIEKKEFTPGSELHCFYDPQLDVKFAILICFDLNITCALAKLAVANGCEIIFSPTLIRDEGLENWKIYIQARALECRVPVVACNSIFNYLDRKFLGYSKIIQFKRGSPTPIRLLVEEATAEPNIMVKEIDLGFPNRVRGERLEESVAISKIRVVDHSK